MVLKISDVLTIPSDYGLLQLRFGLISLPNRKISPGLLGVGPFTGAPSQAIQGKTATHQRDLQHMS